MRYVLLLLLPGCVFVDMREYPETKCNPSPGTYKYSYVEVGGTCGPQPDGVETYRGKPDGVFSEDRCSFSYRKQERTYTVEAEYTFNEDWTYGKGMVHVVDKNCESWYESTITKL